MSDGPTADLRRVLQQAGWDPDSPPEMIRRGGNNRVHKVTCGGRPYLVKEYFQHPGDPRDRFGTERAFYGFLESAGIRQVPRAVAWIEPCRTGLFEFVEGSRPAAVTDSLLDQAIVFLTALNRYQDRAAGLGDASEACFSLEDHLACVGRRVTRLSRIECLDAADAEAASFVENELLPAWSRIRDKLANQSRETELTRIVSPSDFGFHNTLLATDGRLVFLDFEYAGWDDPAKTVCDFFLQPEVPVPMAMLPSFLAALNLPGLEARVAALLPVYRVKWTCILLNEFLPAGRLRRGFARPATEAISHRQSQLARARNVLAAGPG